MTALVASLGGVDTSNGYQLVSKFGRATVGTTFSPVCYQVTTDGPVYRTPKASAAVNLRVKAGNANDTAGGSGARAITLEGIGNKGHYIKETVITAGASAGPATMNKFMRLYRAYVADSGTYASQSAGSHAASIEIENEAGTENWLKIDVTDFPRAQSEIAAYTIPNGKIGYLTRFNFSVDSAKIAELVFFKRENILQESAPYNAMRVLFTVSNINNEGSRDFNPLNGPFPANSDIGVLAKVDSTSVELHVDFDLVLIDAPT